MSDAPVAALMTLTIAAVPLAGATVINSARSDEFATNVELRTTVIAPADSARLYRDSSIKSKGLYRDLRSGRSALVFDGPPPVAFQSREGLIGYLSRKLTAFASSTGPADSVAPHVATWALQVFTDATDADQFVFPAIAPDGDSGAVLYWRAGNATIEVELASDFSYYLRATDQAGQEIFEHEGIGTLPATELMSALRDLSLRVNLLNPSWRESLVA